MAWTSHGLDSASQGLARASLGLAWASPGLAQASGGNDRWTDGQTNGRIDGISPHSTGLRPLSGLLPKKAEEEEKPVNHHFQDVSLGGGSVSTDY